MNVFGLKGQDRRVVQTPRGVSCPDIINRVLCVRLCVEEAEIIVFMSGSIGLSEDA